MEEHYRDWENLQPKGRVTSKNENMVRSDHHFYCMMYFKTISNIQENPHASVFWDALLPCVGVSIGVHQSRVRQPSKFAMAQLRRVFEVLRTCWGPTRMGFFPLQLSTTLPLQKKHPDQSFRREAAEVKFMSFIISIQMLKPWW